MNLFWKGRTVIGTFIIALIALALFVGIGSAPPAASAKETGPTTTNPTTPDDITYPLQEGFENGSLSTSVFHAAVPTCVPGGCGWTIALPPHNGVFAAFAPDVANVADQQLVANNAVVIPANATAVTLSFWHRYGFETSGTNYYDGAVLELSTDNGTSWSDSAVQFTSGGYNGTIHAGGNPLAGRQGWVGTTNNAYTQVQANLANLAGHNVLIRFREGTDTSNSGTGWWVDDIQLTLTTPTTCGAPGWSLLTSYPLTAAFSAGVAHQGRLYVFGGMDSANVAVTTSYMYDPINGWSQIAPLPAGRYGAAAVSDGTYIYILGGNDTNNNPNANLWRYDPVANSYWTLTSYSYPTYLHAAALVSGKIYRIGGSNNNASTNTVEVYTLASNTWTAGPSYPHMAQSLSAVAYGNYILTAGGMQNGGGGGVWTSTYRFNPGNNIWDDASIADLPTGRYAATGDFFAGRWLLTAGYAYPSSDASTIAWNPANNSWQPLPDMVEARHFPAGGTIGQAFYAVGGQDDNSQRSNFTRRYLDVPCTPFTPTPGPSATPNPASPTPGGPTPCPIQFADVDTGNTFYATIRCLACRGIVGGYPCGAPGEPCPGTYFRPNNQVTRGQVSKIVASAVGFQDAIPSTQQSYEDIAPDSTFWLWIERLAMRSVIGGYPCGGAGEPCVAPGNRPYFRPNNNVTRGQLAKIVSGAAGWTETPTGQTFADVAPASTFYLYIERVSSRGVVNGYPCGGAGEPCVAPDNRPYFRPANNATRGQMSKIAAQAFFPNCQTPGAAAVKP